MFTLFALIFGKHLPPGLRYGLLAFGLVLLAWRIHKIIKKTKEPEPSIAKITPQIVPEATIETKAEISAEKPVEVSPQELSGLIFAGFK